MCSASSASIASEHSLDRFTVKLPPGGQGGLMTPSTVTHDLDFVTQLK